MKSEQKDYYDEFYEKLVYTGSVGIVSNLIHKILERTLDPDKDSNKVLEVGAGQGQHLKFVKKYNEYFETDLQLSFLPKRETMKPLDSSLANDPLRVATIPKIIQGEVNAEQLSIYPDGYFDRVIATCLLVHLIDPEEALREWRRVLSVNGCLSIYLPCEPGILLRISRHFTTGRKAKKMGQNHLSFHYREHISYFSRLNLLILENFKDDNVKRNFFPFRLPFWNLNLGVIYQIQKYN